jgi:hypothetical protein
MFKGVVWLFDQSRYMRFMSKKPKEQEKHGILKLCCTCKYYIWQAS